MSDSELQVGKPVSGLEFVGRGKDIEQITNLLISGQSVVLLAPRRFGKTSLILEVLERLNEKNFDTAYVDIFTTPDLKRFSETFTSKIFENRKLGKIIRTAKKNIGELIRNVEFKSSIEDFEIVLKFGQADISQWELTEESIEFAEIFAKKYNRKLIVGLDEFGDIEKLGGKELGKLLRAKMQTQKNVTYIYSGSYESVMNQLFTTSKSPFYRFARIIMLGYIDIEAFEELYKLKLEKASLHTNPKLIKRILDFTKGHPYYSSLFLQQWLLTGKGLDTSPEIAFIQLLNAILDIEKAYLEKLWEDVSNSYEQRSLLIALTESRKPYTTLDIRRINVSRTITALRNKGIVHKRKEGYCFTDPIFETWMRREVLKEDF